MEHDSPRTELFANAPFTDLSEDNDSLVWSSDESNDDFNWFGDACKDVNCAISPDAFSSDTEQSVKTLQNQCKSSNITTEGTLSEENYDICNIDIDNFRDNAYSEILSVDISDMEFSARQTDFVLDAADLRDAIERPQWGRVKTLLTQFRKGLQDDNARKRLIHDIINVVYTEFKNGGRFLLPQLDQCGYWSIVTHRKRIEAKLEELINTNSIKEMISGGDIASSGAAALKETDESLLGHTTCANHCQPNISCCNQIEQQAEQHPEMHTMSSAELVEMASENSLEPEIPSDDSIVLREIPSDVASDPREIPSDCTAVVLPRENDVILGQGHGSNKHPGNIHFREQVEQQQQQYARSSKKEKTKRSDQLLRDLWSKGVRFLKRVQNGSNEVETWVIQTDVKDLREKIAQRFRETIAQSSLEQQRNKKFCNNIVLPSDDDVVIRGDRNHVGNEKLRQIAASFLHSREDKTSVITSIIAAVHEGQGRFIKMNEETKLYEEAGKREVRKKVSFVLKGALESLKRTKKKKN